MSQTEKMRPQFEHSLYIDGPKKGKFNDENDEGIFVFESNGEDDDDYEYEMYREPRTEFEKSLSKIDNSTRQIEEDTEMFCQDLKSLQSKNERTELRILKLMRNAAEFRAKLQGLLGSFSTKQRYGNVEEHIIAVKEEDTLSALPSIHKASLKVLLKQNSIEQPIHVNIAIDDSGANYVHIE